MRYVACFISEAQGLAAISLLLYPVKNCGRHTKLRLHYAICRLRLYSNLFIHILSLSKSHNDVASIQKNRGINRTV